MTRHQVKHQANPKVHDLFTCSSFLVPSNIAHISGNQIVTKGDDVTLNCTATGNPTPAITWTRLSDNSVVGMPLTNITRQEKGGYRCTADNGVGSADTKDVFITVQCKCWNFLFFFF